MIEVYHWEPNAASARVLITLEEKRLKFESRYLDVLAFEQFTPESLDLNPFGQVPILVDGEEVFSEASYICEYLDETYPDPPLLPESALDRWAARAWQKYVDDYLAAAVADLAWPDLGLPALKVHAPQDIEAAVSAIPLKERRDQWQAAVGGPDPDVLDKARERIRLATRKTEADLAERDWLAPGGYSLADIAVYPYLAYLPRIAPDALAERTAAWLQRMRARPAVQAAEATSRTGDPYGIAAPGPEHIRWG